MSAKEETYDHIAGVPLHYDRLEGSLGYGSKGDHRSFQSRKILKTTLDTSFAALFDIWGRGVPDIILTAGTIGDGGNAHGRGYAFDLDGFYWGSEKFMMDQFPDDPVFYTGINAHLYLFFSQVLSYQYPDHHDHFHVDFNFSFVFRTASNAQTNFVQSALRYVYGKDIGTYGAHNDGVDGVYGEATRAVLMPVLNDLGLGGRGGLTNSDVWRDFLVATRTTAFQ